MPEPARPRFDPSAAALPGSGIFGLPHAPADAGVILIPVPFDATTSYRRGAAGGPRTILDASRQVDLLDLDTGRPFEDGIALLPENRSVRDWNRAARRLADPLIARGGVTEGDTRAERAGARIDALCAAVNAWVRGTAEAWLDRDRIVGVVGGDHATPFGAIEAHAARHPGLGILHVDAHSDLRRAYEGFTWSHASIMYNVLTRIPDIARIVQVGVRDTCDDEVETIRASGGRVRCWYDSEIRDDLLSGTPFDRIAKAVVADLPGAIYVSFDIDGLDPSLCPHTGTPVPGGLSFHMAVRLLLAVVESGRRIVGFDLSEVAPGPRGDTWDGNVGARLLYKLIGATRQSRAGDGGDRPRRPSRRR